jgi:hypothetical protein
MGASRADLPRRPSFSDVHTAPTGQNSRPDGDSSCGFRHKAWSETYFDEVAFCGGSLMKPDTCTGQPLISAGFLGLEHLGERDPWCLNKSESRIQISPTKTSRHRAMALVAAWISVGGAISVAASMSLVTYGANTIALVSIIALAGIAATWLITKTPTGGPES